MATVREGNKRVLLVVDVQVGVMREAWDSPRIIKNVSRAVERARAQGAPVMWVQHADENLVHGSAEWEWVPELKVAEGEPLIHKRFNSSFEQTALEEELAKRGVTHIALAGAIDQLVHSCDGVWRARSRVRPDPHQGRAHHRHNGARQRGEDRGRKRRPRAQHRDDLAQLSRPRERDRYGRRDRLRHPHESNGWAMTAIRLSILSLLMATTLSNAAEAAGG